MMSIWAGSTIRLGVRIKEMAGETPEEPDDAQSPVLGSANGLGVLKEGWDEPMSDEESEELFGQPIPDFLDAAIPFADADS